MCSNMVIQGVTTDIPRCSIKLNSILKYYAIMTIVIGFRQVNFTLGQTISICKPQIFNIN